MHDFISSDRLQKGTVVVFPVLAAADLDACVRVEERHRTEGTVATKL